VRVRPVERLLWLSNDVLEAFGNAATSVNANSSRSAMAVQLLFTDIGSICGGVLLPVHLESSRVAFRASSPPQRNFHIFYQVWLPLWS
jgi:myosin V